MSDVNPEKIKKQAQAELEHEKFREAVEREKVRLKTKKSPWDIVFPWRIKIERKHKK